ncbi:Di-copper centre-containing protein [Xylariaceae sp. FL0594]|nr:Di-copper centre-containing protein [Xylariaceae sp. FL0594]
MFFESRKCTLFWAFATSLRYVDAQTETVPVVGMSTGFDQATSIPPSRLEIRVLMEAGGPMWDLFIRGLDALQSRPEGDERSYFQLAGIHGRPYIPYNGVGPVASQGPSWGGYCPHMSPQLIPWHRVYVALYEQVLGEEVQRLASEYTDDQAPAYHEAAQKFRLPYWDWASDPSLPPSFGQENVTVNGPDGELVLRNPLYSYRWQTYPLNATLFPGQENMSPETVRGDLDAVNRQLLAAADSIKDSVYRAFSSSTTYEQMASMSGGGASFEQPHNLIHNLVGGLFPNLDLTAFDPLFMLHHSNLDRLAALWSYIHNETVQTAPFTSQGLYATAKGESITADSPLKPFYQADGSTFHTGRTAATTVAFGYTYPEFSLLGPGQNQGKRVIAQINKQYGGLTAIGKVAVAINAPNAANAPNFSREFFVGVSVDRVDLPLPCSIYVYLGSDLVGRVPFLSMPQMGRTYDEIPLSRAIRHLDLGNDDLRAVESSLASGLHVDVIKDDGTFVDPRDVASLDIKVVGEDVTPPSSEFELPSSSNRETLFSIYSSREKIRCTANAQAPSEAIRMAMPTRSGEGRVPT